MSPRLHLFDQQFSKISNIVNIIKIKNVFLLKTMLKTVMLKTAPLNIFAETEHLFLCMTKENRHFNCSFYLLTKANKKWVLPGVNCALWTTL